MNIPLEEDYATYSVVMDQGLDFGAGREPMKAHCKKLELHQLVILSMYLGIEANYLSDFLP